VGVRRVGVVPRRGNGITERDEDGIWGIVGVRDADGSFCSVDSCAWNTAAAGATSTLFRNDASADEVVVWYDLVLSVDALERETCCLLDDCGGRSVNASSTRCISSSGGGIIGVFMSIVIVSVSEAMVKLGEGIIVYVTNVIRKLFNNL